MTERVLYLVTCAAGPAGRIDVMVNLAQAQGWSVHCLATPAAVEHFLDVPALAALTGHPVRTTYRTSGDESLPRADAVIVAPATYNTINKWAAGVADNYVLNQLAELTGLGARIVVLPFVNQGLAANQVFVRSVEQLRQAGVRVLFGPENSNRTRHAPAVRYSTVTRGIAPSRQRTSNATQRIRHLNLPFRGKQKQRPSQH